MPQYKDKHSVLDLEAMSTEELVALKELRLDQIAEAERARQGLMAQIMWFESELEKEKIA